ncbi:MAG: enoyl-CoA hydratase [Alphaproteobacteria bacterium]|nr:enoyl-CoA hydratase [Alphaproteobacteria bacterium]
MNTDPPVLLRLDRDGICTLTLNRPEARNALSEELIDALQGEFDAIASDESVRAVVLAANGPAFCAGHDMRQMRAHPTMDYYEALFAKSSRLMMSILRLPQPVIARVHGTATAAGSQLVGTCDLAVATESVRIATPGVNIGLFCSTPMVAVSRNVGRKRAMEMLITGAPITAREAERFGLVNRVVDDSELDASIAELCRAITSKSAMVMRIGKEAFYRQLEMGVEDAYSYTAAVMAKNMMADDAVEGIDAFIAKRQPVWKDR